MTVESQSVIANQYRLIEKLGQGAMGVVYKAEDRLSTKPVALKLLHVHTDELQLSSERYFSNATTALINEFRILASLRHPNIISVFDYGLYRDQPYIVMELLGGGKPFDEAVANLDTPAKIKLIIQVLDALTYLHRRNTIHRDLKPSNIYVVDGQVKLLDFGLSVMEQTARGRTGTLVYMAPETLAQSTTVPQSDLYAVGVLAYEAFVGHVPFAEDDVMGIINSPPDMSLLIDYPCAHVIERLLRKNPTERYSTAQEAKLALANSIDLAIHEDVGVRESFLRASKFVGRDAELSVLKQALNQAKEGVGSTWLVGGESGVGKSRLIDEFRTQALIEGAKVVHGQGVEGGGLPYQLWRPVIRRLILSPELSNLEASILKEIVPDINDLLGKGVADAPELQGEALKHRLHTTILKVFKQQTGLTVLLLEDLQWADEDLDILKQLSQLAADMPLLIVGSYRNDEYDQLPHDLSIDQVITLGRLQGEDIQQLSQSMLGEIGKNPGLVTFLQTETEGNAFFMVEIVRELAETAGHLSNIGDVSLPEEIFTFGIEQIIQRRLDKIPEHYRPLLNIAGVLGRQIDIRLLTYLNQGNSISLDDWLMACADAYVIEIIEGSWRFAHDKLREGVVRSLDQKQTPGTYRKAALAIEAVYPDNTYAATLINLWRQAANPAKELHYLLIEGKRLNELAGFNNAQQAKVTFERAIEILPEQEFENENYLNIALGMGVAHIATHELQEANQWFQKAVPLAHKLEQPDQAAHALLGLARSQMTELEQSKIIALLDEALELAFAAEDQFLVASSLGVQGYMYAHYNDFESALEVFMTAADALETAKTDYELATMLNNIGKLLQMKGQYSEAQEYLEKSRQISLDVGHFNNAVLSTSNLAATSFFQKKYDSAIKYYGQSIELMQNTGDLAGLSHVWVLKLLAEAELDDLPSVRNSLNQAIQTRHEAMLDFSNVFILLGGVRLSLMEGQIKQSALFMGLAEKHGGANPFIREWLDPLKEQLAHFVTESALPDLLEEGADLDADEVINRLLSATTASESQEEFH